MAEVSVNFVNTDESMITVNLDDTTTVQEAISELTTAQFITAIPNGYILTLKASGERSSTELPHDRSFREMKVRNGDSIRIVPKTVAGQLTGFYIKDLFL